MEKLLEKISSYNILNNLIPGAIFIGLCNYLGVFSYHSESVLIEIAIYYFCGMTVSRVGSLVIESILKVTKAIVYNPKEHYVIAEAKDPKIDELLAVSNLYRTIAGMFFTIIVIELYEELLSPILFFNSFSLWLILASLLTIYTLSFCKQTKHITSRVNAVNKESSK